LFLEDGDLLGRMLRYAALPLTFTFLLIAAIGGSMATRPAHPAFDVAI
jgi:hypothetical protein